MKCLCKLPFGKTASVLPAFPSQGDMRVCLVENNNRTQDKLITENIKIFF